MRGQQLTLFDAEAYEQQMTAEAPAQRANADDENHDRHREPTPSRRRRPVRRLATLASALLMVAMFAAPASASEVLKVYADTPNGRVQIAAWVDDRRVFGPSGEIACMVDQLSAELTLTDEVDGNGDTVVLDEEQLCQ